jgi:hypothetical protein
MIDRLQRAIEALEALPPTLQEAAAEQLEQFTALLAPSPLPRRSYAGIWADLPDDMEETLDQWRHAVPPTPFADEDNA